MDQARRFVYVLRSEFDSTRYYVGSTSNPGSRVAAHNDGVCPHTRKYRPWVLHVLIQFPDERRALAFERYLESGSGRAFARRHFD